MRSSTTTYSISDLYDFVKRYDKEFSTGKSVNLLVDAIANDSNTSAKLFYINKKSATALLNASGVQFPGGKAVHDGTIHSIRENTSFVKSKFQNVTETQQFKRWFGDWKKHPEAASKVVNADGTPKVVYHQTDAEFTVFDTRREGSVWGEGGDGERREGEV